MANPAQNNNASQNVHLLSVTCMKHTCGLWIPRFKLFQCFRNHPGHKLHVL